MTRPQLPTRPPDFIHPDGFRYWWPERVWIGLSNPSEIIEIKGRVIYEDTHYEDNVRITYKDSILAYDAWVYKQLEEALLD